MDNLKSILKLFTGAFSIGIGAYLLLMSNGTLFGDTEDASNREIVKRIEEQENVAEQRTSEMTAKKKAVDEAFDEHRRKYAEQKAMIDRKMAEEGGISSRYDNAVESAAEEQEIRHENTLSALSAERDNFEKHRASIAE